MSLLALLLLGCAVNAQIKTSAPSPSATVTQEYYLRAKIAAKLGKCDIAVEDATKGLELAKKANDAAYVSNHTKVLKSCGKVKN